MAFEHADTLKQIADDPAGRKLSAGERRRVLVYLIELGETKTVAELSRMFRVNEKTVRGDQRRLLKRAGEALTPDQGAFIVAQHLEDINQLIVRTRTGLGKNDPGTLGERNYIETLAKLFEQRLKVYQESGVVRKELGNLNVAQEVWTATVADDGICSVVAEKMKES